MKCQSCNNEMIRYGKKFNFFTVLLISLFIWPMLLILPFTPFLPVLHKCKSCKKVYKEKDLKKQATFE